MSDPAHPSDSPSAASAPSGSLPWYSSIGIAIGLCLIYCSYAYEAFWLLPQRHPGTFIGYFLASLVLIPIAAALGTIPWFLASRAHRQKPGFAPYVLGSLVCVVALLYFGDSYMKQTSAREEATQAAARQSALAEAQAEVKKIVLFDGSIHWQDSPGTDRRYMSSISGRIRNEASRGISHVRIGVAIRGGDGAVIETFEFSPPEIDRYSPLKPGHAISFEHRNYVDRLPKDMKWGWKILDARFDTE